MFTGRKLTAGLGLGLAALLLAACGGGGDPLAPSSSAAPSSSGSGSASAPIVVGYANFTENQILAEIYSQALAAKGIQSSTKAGGGSREVYLTALKEGTLSIVPEYTGNLLLNFDANTKAKSAEEVEQALPAALPTGLKILKSSAAVDQDVYVVSKDFADKNGVASLADLAKISGGVTVGGFSELPKRAYGPKGLTATYKIKVKEFKPFDSDELMGSELNKGNLDVADLFTTSSAISRNNLVQLTDPEQLILPQNVIPLVGDAVAANTTATGALDAVQAALTTEDLISLNSKVGNDKEDPDQVAGDWLKSKGLA